MSSWNVEMRAPSRARMISLERALRSARHVSDSKLGQAIIKNNTGHVSDSKLGQAVIKNNCYTGHVSDNKLGQGHLASNTCRPTGATSSAPPLPKEPRDTLGMSGSHRSQRTAAVDNDKCIKIVTSLEVESRRLEKDLRRKKRKFLSGRSRGPGPSLIVERPLSSTSFLLPHPSSPRRREGGELGVVDVREEGVPGYMKSTVSCRRKRLAESAICWPMVGSYDTHDVTTTIDAFRVTSRRSANVWEQVEQPTNSITVYSSTHRPTSTYCRMKFRPAVRPSVPLTEHEQDVLRYGWLNPLTHQVQCT